MRTPPCAAAALLAAALVSASGCRAEPRPAPILRPVHAALPGPSACSEHTRFSGNVEPLVRVDLAFKRGGYIAELLRVRDHGLRAVEEGDPIRTGAVLARLNDGDYRVKLEQARAQLTQARVALTQAEQDLQRTRTQYASGAMPPMALDGAQNRANAAKAQVNAAAALVREADLALSDCALRSPIDGVVLKRLVEVGSLVGPGTPGFVVADTTSMKVVFGVPDLLLDRVPTGAAVEVTIDALGATVLQGKVGRVSPLADARSRLFDVEVVLPNRDGGLRAGMIASLRLAGAPAAPGVSVPLSAIVRPPGKAEGFAVYVASAPGADGATLELRQVVPGKLCETDVELLSGVRPGERVITDGASLAYPGERVNVVTDDGATASAGVER